MNIIYAALPMREQTENTFSCKDNSGKALHIYWSGGKGPTAQSFVLKMQPFNNFYIDEAHTVLDIFRFAVFFFYLVVLSVLITLKLKYFTLIFRARCAKQDPISSRLNLDVRYFL